MSTLGTVKVLPYRGQGTDEKTLGQVQFSNCINRGSKVNIPKKGGSEENMYIFNVVTM